MSVNVLRKASTKDDIQSLAKTLIKNWKKLLGESACKVLLAHLFNAIRLKFECSDLSMAASGQSA